MPAPRLTLVVAAVLAVSVAAWAGPVVAPSFLGPSGALLSPNTEVNDLHTLDVGAHVMFINPAPGDATMTVAKVNVCVLEDLEITPTFFSFDWDLPGPQDITDDAFTVSAKYQLCKEPESKLGLAVGALDLAGEQYSNIPYYIVVSKTCDSIWKGRDWRWNWGVVFGTDDVFMNLQKNADSYDVEESRFFTSLEAEIADWFTFIGEVADEDFNFGGRFVPCDRLRVDIASVNFGSEAQFTVGASYHVDF